MNTDRLVAAYDDLLAAAALLDLASLAAPQRDEAEWLVAHLILSDPILIAAADHLLEGADTVFVDNRHAMDDDAITTVLASLSHHDRIQAVKHNGSELIDRHRRIPEIASSTTVALHLHDRHGQLTHQGTTTWADLLGCATGESAAGEWTGAVGAAPDGAVFAGAVVAGASERGLVGPALAGGGAGVGAGWPMPGAAVAGGVVAGEAGNRRVQPGSIQCGSVKVTPPGWGRPSLSW